MYRYISFLFSRHKSVYKEIAKTYKCSAFYVYSIAHGRKAHSHKDYQIIHTLIEKKIITGFRWM